MWLLVVFVLVVVMVGAWLWMLRVVLTPLPYRDPCPPTTMLH